ncbi:MAG: histidine phosphatase family protein [Pseudomonadota bacterium]
MTKILLARHGHVEGIKPERFRGREPLELTERGRAQAAALAARIAAAFRPSKIYTSPMGRCVDTAAAIAKACGIAAEVCADLNDIDYGAWQVRTFQEAKEDNPSLFKAWMATPHLVRFPNGESLQDLGARSANALRFVIAQHPEDTIVLVAHDSVNRTLLLQLLELPLSAYWRIAQEPCCLNEIDLAGGKICIRRLNETQHLDAIERSGRAWPA